MRSEPIVETERVPRQECTDQQVTRQKPVKDEKRVAGAAIGAVLGGVLGHQVGDGDGQKLATVAGAVAGGYAGSKVQKRIQENNTETVTEKVCKTVYDTKEKKVGYQVTYSVGGEMHTQRMANDPGVGAHVPVKDGRLVLNARTGASDRGTT
ncbi:MAG: glycine zipper 2TM domain-containing protein [Steroidobacteraceae bacterium]